MACKRPSGRIFIQAMSSPTHSHSSQKMQLKGLGGVAVDVGQDAAGRDGAVARGAVGACATDGGGQVVGGEDDRRTAIQQERFEMVRGRGRPFGA